MDHLGKLTLFVLIFSALTTSEVVANEPLAVTGVGATTCSKLLEMDRMNAETSKLVFSAFLDGYLSGYNMANAYEANKRLVSLETPIMLDGTARYNWLMSTCKKEPSLFLYVAATQLFWSLRDAQ